jgi:hypothetical protein
VNARLIWIGRRSQDHSIEEKLARINSAGGEAIYISADAGNFEELNAAWKLAQEKWGAIHGVIQSTMVFKDAPVRKLEAALCNEVLHPQTTGTATLFEVLKNQTLDFLILFSSGQSFFNEPSRGAYAAACCFKDAFGHLMKSRVGFPVCVLNWGFWGHSADAGLVQMLQELGTGVIEPEDGAIAVETLLSSGLPQVFFLKASEEALMRMKVQFEPRKDSPPPPMKKADLKARISAAFKEGARL